MTTWPFCEYLNHALDVRQALSCGRLHYFYPVGTWLSLVEHSVRDAGVGGSNPLVPTIPYKCKSP